MTTGRAAEALDALLPVRQARAAALARPATARVAAEIAAAGHPVTASEIAETLGLHHSSVRDQIAALERAHVVEGHTDPPNGRGRPVRRYVPAPDPAERESMGHRELVRLLMGLVRQMGLGPEEMESFGAAQGWSVSPDDAGLDEVHDAFDRMGFQPRRVAGEPRDLVLDSCPFADGVEAPGGELICVLHRGLAKGIVGRTAPGTEVEDLVVEDPRRAGCRLRLRTSGATPGA